MKKLIFGLGTFVALASCGGKDEVATDAQSICDCFAKAREATENDPNRLKNMNDCAKKQMELHEKYKSDSEKSVKFTQALLECDK